MRQIPQGGGAPRNTMLHHDAEAVCAACGAPAALHITNVEPGGARSQHFCGAHGFTELLELVQLEMHPPRSRSKRGS